MSSERQRIDTRGFIPHPGQVELLQATHRYRVVTAAVGRRWGKTEAAKLALLDHAPLATGRRYEAAYCAPTYRLAKPIYEEVKHTCGALVEKASDTDLTLRLRPMGCEYPGKGWSENKGAVLHFWSLEEHDHLRGRGLDFVVVDECADVVEAAYTQTLTPMTAGTRGRFLLIGTPRRVGVGFVWFRSVWNRGKDTVAYPDHYSMNGPTEQNPYMPADFVKVLRESATDQLAVREEYDAEFLEEEGAVFERLSDAFCLPCRAVGTSEWVLAAGGSEAPVADVQHVLAADFGRHGDPTVLSVFRRDTREQVAVVRMFNEEYETQLERIHLMREKYRRATIYADGQGLGGPLVERLARRYRDGVVDARWSSNSVKEEAITRARLLFQRAEWKFLDVPWQRAEFQNYTREKLPASGRWRYGAPEGGHDDAVAAACMASEVLGLPWVAPRKPVGPPVPLSMDWIDWVTKGARRWRNRGSRSLG